MLCTRDGAANAILVLLSFKIPHNAHAPQPSGLAPETAFPASLTQMLTQSISKLPSNQNELDDRLNLSPHAFKISLEEAARPRRLQRSSSMQI